MSTAAYVRPGQVYAQYLSIGDLGGVQYHVLAVYEGFVWALVVFPGVRAARQRTEPKTFSLDFFRPDSNVLYLKYELDE